MSDDVTVSTFIMTAQVTINKMEAHARVELPCCARVWVIPPRLDRRRKYRLCEHGAYVWRGVLHRPPWPDMDLAFGRPT